jgi:hypothetical protein
MLLGTLIKQVMHAQNSFADEIAGRDPDLAARIAADAEAKGMTSATYVADTVQRFMGAEDGESWTSIIGNMQRAEDPGYAFIETVLRKRLSHQCGH